MKGLLWCAKHLPQTWRMRTADSKMATPVEKRIMKPAVMEFTTAESWVTIDIHPRMTVVYGDACVEKRVNLFSISIRTHLPKDISKASPSGKSDVDYLLELLGNNSPRIFEERLYSHFRSLCRNFAETLRKIVILWFCYSICFVFVWASMHLSNTTMLAHTRVDKLRLHWNVTGLMTFYCTRPTVQIWHLVVSSVSPSW